jgi:hypothetical protein
MPELWPATFGARALLPVNGAKHWTVELSSLSDPRFAALGTPDADGLKGAKFFGYWKAAPADDARVLGRFDNGDVWLVGKPVGFGRVLVMTSGLEGMWNNLPVRSAYVHLMHRLAAYAAEGRTRPLNLRPGEEITAFMGPDEVAALSGPLGSPETGLSAVLSNTTRQGRRLAVYAGRLDTGGLYVLRRVGGDRGDEAYVSVYDDRAEGDVQGLDDEQQEAVCRQIPWRVVRTPDELRAFIAEQVGGKEIHAWIIASVLGLLFVESWLSRQVGA